MTKTIRLMSAVTLSLSAVFAATSYAEPVVKKSGDILVDAQGMTLYTFDKDVANSGKSVCNGPCAKLWPPVAVAANAKPEGDLSIVTRDDGSKQWAYQGKPIYTYAADKVAGDVTGDNFKDVWHVIK
jgi:predicted lipoprotein with Yx(FWY)xxD motif